MTDLRKAAEMALELLENHVEDPRCEIAIFKTMLALRLALAQPEQKPVAWLGVYRGVASDLAFQDFDIVVDNDWTRLPLYTAPPKREWVGLTDEDKVNIRSMWVLNGRFEECLDATEAKLKEKNT